MNPKPQVTNREMRIQDRAVGSVLDIDVSANGGDVLDGPAVADLFGDVFWGLFGRDLADEPARGREVNHAIQRWAEGTPGWTKATQNTRGNLPATIATSAFMFGALANDEAIKAALEAANKAAEAKAKADGLQYARERGAEVSASDVAAAQAAADEAAQAAGEVAEKVAGNAFNQAVMRQITDAASEEGEKVAAIMRGFGSGQGNGGIVDPQAALDLVNRIDDKIKAIMEVAGRVQAMAAQARRQEVGQGVVPVNVGMTRDIGKVLPSEGILLHDDAPKALRDRQWVRFFSDGLLGYQMEETEDDAGPFIAAVDVSGSMYGGLETRAKGVALGCAMQARDEDMRPYRLFLFSSDSDDTVDVASGGDWRAHVEWCERTIGGGTSFSLALSHAMDLAEEMDGGDKADVLIISDGQGRVGDDVRERWNAFKDEAGARLIYVDVTGHAGGDIDGMADEVIRVDVMDGQAVDKVAARVGLFTNR